MLALVAYYMHILAFYLRSVKFITSQKDRSLILCLTPIELYIYNGIPNVKANTNCSKVVLQGLICSLRALHMLNKYLGLSSVLEL